MKIPEYPASRELEISDSEIFANIFKKEPPVISEFTFPNIYSWRGAYKFRISSLGSLILVSMNTSSPQLFLEPVGAGDKKEAVKKLIKDSDGVFVRVSEKLRNELKCEEGLATELDRDNSDYLYLSRDLIELSGRKYHGKRNLIKNFKSAYRYEYAKLGKENASECLEFEAAWCDTRHCAAEKNLDNERRAVETMINNCAVFNLVGGAVKVNGKMCALCVGGALNPETIVIHILKARHDMRGLYQVINNEFMAREAAGYKFVNMEEDLGIEGLRKAKGSYHPVEMINKYTIRKK